jgi:hypothetical protein
MPHNLHPIIINHVRQNVESQGYAFPDCLDYSSNTSLIGLFVWDDTKEGNSFWAQGHSHNFNETYFRKYPQLTIPNISLNNKLLV